MKIVKYRNKKKVGQILIIKLMIPIIILFSIYTYNFNFNKTAEIEIKKLGLEKIPETKFLEIRIFERENILDLVFEDLIIKDSKKTYKFDIKINGIEYKEVYNEETGIKTSEYTSFVKQSKILRATGIKIPEKIETLEYSIYVVSSEVNMNSNMQIIQPIILEQATEYINIDFKNYNNYYFTIIKNEDKKQLIEKNNLSSDEKKEQERLIKEKEQLESDIFALQTQLPTIKDRATKERVEKQLNDYVIRLEEINLILGVENEKT